MPTASDIVYIDGGQILLEEGYNFVVKKNNITNKTEDASSKLTVLGELITNGNWRSFLMMLMLRETQKTFGFS